jgi:thiol:disulfide interchange protein DsbD
MFKHTKRPGIRGLYGWIFTWILLLLVFTVSRLESSDVMNLHLEFSQDSVVAGGRLGVMLVVKMSGNWHVYAPVDEGAYTIPIEPGLEFEGSNDSRLEWVYPEPEYLRMAGADEPAAVYGGTFILQTEITVPKEVDERFTIVGSLYFQACDDRHCLFPLEKKAEATLPVRGRFDQIQKTDVSNLDAARARTEGTADEESGEISALMEDYGLLVTFFLIFLGGLALNLTPCVYPLIPITISFFGAVDASRRGKTFWKALTYVLGIAVTYSILGVVAALGGGLFGALLTHPAVLIGIAMVLVGLSLSMFGVYEFRLPSGLMNSAGQTKSGIIGALFMGITMGIIAAPCVGPLVIGLLTYVAVRQSVVLGFLMFFVLSMGLGFPYLFLAMFSSHITSLPRSGAWMVGVRVMFGLILIAMAIYFLRPLLGAWGDVLMAAFFFGAGVYLIIDKNGNDARAFVIIKRIIAVAVMAIAAWLIIPTGSETENRIDWIHPTTDQELGSAIQMGKPAMIDFYADWCIPCKEMDRFTFSHKDVIEISRSYTMIKVDLTREKGEFEKSVQQQFRIKGVPTYLFISSKGKEKADLRSTGFEKPERFVKRLEAGLKP